MSLNHPHITPTQIQRTLTYIQIFDIPVSITIIPDCFPALFNMMESRFGGALNLVNPMPISLHEILQLYKEFAHPNLPDYEVVTTTSEKGKQLMATKGNCSLDTALLQSFQPDIKSSFDSLKENFKKIANK